MADDDELESARVKAEWESQRRWDQMKRGLSAYAPVEIHKKVQRRAKSMVVQDRTKWFGGLGLLPGDLISPAEAPPSIFSCIDEDSDIAHVDDDDADTNSEDNADSETAAPPSTVDAEATDVIPAAGALSSSDRHGLIGYHAELERLSTMESDIKRREELVFFREAACAQAELQHKAAKALMSQLEQREKQLQDREIEIEIRRKQLDAEVLKAVNEERERLFQLIDQAEALTRLLQSDLVEREKCLDAKIASMKLHETTFNSREAQLRADYEKQLAVLEKREKQLADKEHRMLCRVSSLPATSHVTDEKRRDSSPSDSSASYGDLTHTPLATFSPLLKLAASYSMSPLTTRTMADATYCGQPSEHHTHMAHISPARSDSLDAGAGVDWHDYYARRFGLGLPGPSGDNSA